jgi:maltokinase
MLEDVEESPVGTTSARLPVPGGHEVSVLFSESSGAVTVSDVTAVARWLTRLPSAPVRSIVADQTHQSVVVGERVVVKFFSMVDDEEHPALRAVSHLDEVGFAGMPGWEGALTVKAPSGRLVPLALMTAYLPGAEDGWAWCPAAFPASFAASIGSLAARLHVALATASSVIPSPVATDSPATYVAPARARLSELASTVRALDRAPAGPQGQPPRRRASSVFGEYRGALAAAVGTLRGLPETPVQVIHGDLHVGQFLRRPEGLAVTDFDGNPILPPDLRSRMQPAARDLAQLLVSVDQVARIVDRRSGFTRTAEASAWSSSERASLLSAYFAELNTLGRPELLDAALLPAFVAEQCVRDLLYSAQHLPRWAYATLEGLPTLFPG